MIMKKITGFLIFTFCMMSVAAAQPTELIIKNGDLQIGGTLLLPEGNRAEELVIMSSGMGQHNRDEKVLRFEIFKVIAEDLAERGVATFRYDDRGVGSSTGDFESSTLDDLVSDVFVIMDHFKNESDPAFSEFVHLGHGMGALVGIKAAGEREDITQLIFMAAPLVPMNKVLSRQIAIIQESLGRTEEEIQIALDFRDLVYEAVRSDEKWDTVKTLHREITEWEVKKSYHTNDVVESEVDKYADMMYQREVEPFKTPMMRSLLFYDPAPDLASVTIPVFALYGSKDTEITIEQNLNTLNVICARNNLECTSKIFRNANHLFQRAESGLIDEYVYLQKRFISAFTIDMARWIQNN